MDMQIPYLDEPVVLDNEQPIWVGGETVEESRLTTNIYSEIRKRLAQRGIPPEEVAFIHDAKTPGDRAALFKAVNEGRVRVLIGSSEKMGTGMNAQTRLVAIHQITPPWRPGDLEQQTGRMLRQGNYYPEVYQFVHITSGSFDGYVWQLLENKASFIGQIASGEVTAREVDDVSENVLTFSEIKALASGNPKIMEKVLADTELARLDAVRQAWRNAQFAAQCVRSRLTARQSECERTVTGFREAIAIRNANTREKFTLFLKRDLYGAETVPYTEREQAGKRIRALTAAAAMMIAPGSGECVEIGSYRGLALLAAAERTATGPAPIVFLRIGHERLTVNIGESDAGITQSLDARLRSLEGSLQEAEDEIAVCQQKLASIEEELARPWEHEERYVHLRAKADELTRELDVDAKKPEAEAEMAAVAAPKASAAQADMAAEVLSALAAIRAAHANPVVLARFGVEETPIVIQLPDPEPEVSVGQQALFDLNSVLAAIPAGETVQFDLFGGFASAQPAPKRRRR